jgi:hypothetical protein
MPEANAKRDLEALIKATEDNRAQLQTVWQKVKDLEAAIASARNSRLESQRKGGTAKSGLGSKKTRHF